MMRYSKFAGFLALLGLLLLQLVAAEEDCKLVGKYVFDSDPKDSKVENLLATIGYSNEDIRKIQALAPGTIKEIRYQKPVMTLTITTKVKESKHSFENGKEFTENPLVGSKVQTTPTIEKSKLTLVRKMDTGLVITEVLTCADEGCTSKVTVKDATAEIKWKRIKEQAHAQPEAAGSPKKEAPAGA